MLGGGLRSLSAFLVYIVHKAIINRFVSCLKLTYILTIFFITDMH